MAVVAVSTSLGIPHADRFDAEWANTKSRSMALPHEKFPFDGPKSHRFDPPRTWSGCPNGFAFNDVDCHSNCRSEGQGGSVRVFLYGLQGNIFQRLAAPHAETLLPEYSHKGSGYVRRNQCRLGDSNQFKAVNYVVFDCPQTLPVVGTQNPFPCSQALHICGLLLSSRAGYQPSHSFIHAPPSTLRGRITTSAGSSVWRSKATITRS